ncbi:MAG: PIG-L family deacetylase [Actinobacteria bacterium]|nr:PIG-L family deacetylase [Actinomycetota bacterium]
MATLVTFHAHPDDESIATGGSMAKAAAAGHRVVLVVGTRGEQGEPVEGVLDEGEHLWERRVQETHRSAEILGAERVEFLGYEDSGMMGEPTNDNPNCFWQADVEEAAEKLAALLREVGADVLTIYDDHGGYGHPDHIQVHRVGARAAELTGLQHVFQATMNRDRIRQMMEAQREAGVFDAGMSEEDRAQLEERTADAADFGSPEALITHAIDVSAQIEQKRRSMEAHASQISEESFFMKMPPEVFATAFGTEWFIKSGSSRAEGAAFAGDLFESVSRQVPS